MKHYLISFTTKTPLLFGDRRADQHARSIEYIPGTVCAGGLASAYLLQQGMATGEKDEGFSDLFLKDLIRFGNLYPANFKPYVSGEFPVKPLPHSARSCKRWEGFSYRGTERDDEERHGVADHLIFWTLLAASGEQRKVEPLWEHRNCAYDGCSQPLDRFSGFYRMDRPGVAAKSRLHTRLMTGTGINRQTGTAQEKILFSKEVIAAVSREGEGQLFQGRFSLDESQEETFLDFLEDEALELRIGRAKSRGLGKLQLTDYSEQEPRSLDDFSRRLIQFDAALKAQAERYKISSKENGIDPDAFYFALTCNSDVIIRHKDLRYRTSLSEEYLQQELEIKAPLVLVYQNVSTRDVRGWSRLWRLPKNGERAIEKGSVFLYKYDARPDDAFWNALQQLESNGIGVRKAEGFGWISLSDEFHREVTQR